MGGYRGAALRTRRESGGPPRGRGGSRRRGTPFWRFSEADRPRSAFPQRGGPSSVRISTVLLEIEIVCSVEMLLQDGLE